METRFRNLAGVGALVAAIALTAACRLAAPAAGPGETDSPEPAPSPSPTAFAPGPADSPTAPAATASALPSGEPTGFFGLVIPEDWYHTRVETGEIEAVVFTPIDPAVLAGFDDPGWAVPPDFAIAALARSPLPEGADPEALLAGLDASLAAFSDADLRSLLSGADQIGLIDLSALETVTLTAAERGELGGRPAIAARGAAGFGPDLQPGLEILVRLAWTDDAFFTFYAITSAAAWGSAEIPLAQSMESVELP